MKKTCINCGELLIILKRERVGIKPEKTDRCVDCDKNMNWDTWKWYKRWYPRDTVPGDDSERIR